MAKLVKTEEETMLADMARGFLDDAAPVSKLREMRDAGETHDAKLWKEMAEMGAAEGWELAMKVKHKVPVH